MFGDELRRAFSASACGLALLLGGGCARHPIVEIRAEEVSAHGTATFPGKREDVFRACVEGLRYSGYSVDREDAEQGVVTTTRVRAWTGWTSPGSTVLHRRYELSVQGPPNGPVRLVLVPVLFEVHERFDEARRRGAETAWTARQERREWERILTAIRERLATRGDPR